MLPIHTLYNTLPTTWLSLGKITIKQSMIDESEEYVSLEHKPSLLAFMPDRKRNTLNHSMNHWNIAKMNENAHTLHVQFTCN